MKAAEELAKHVGVKPACDALSVARATFYRLSEAIEPGINSPARRLPGL